MQGNIGYMGMMERKMETTIMGYINGNQDKDKDCYIIQGLGLVEPPPYPLNKPSISCRAWL